jgi:molybdopterin-guanine dinucleotide biosynthesis protein A
MSTLERTTSPSISIAVLCGGLSRRFGAEKALAMAGERPLVEWIVARLSPVTDDLFLQMSPAATAPPGLPVHHDRCPGCGPLSGIQGALGNARHDLVFVCGSDMPSVDPRLPGILASRAGDADAVVPRWENGWIEPLASIYNRRVLPTARARLEGGDFRLSGFLSSLDNVVRVPLEPLFADGSLCPGCFSNINSRDELMQWVEGGPLSPAERA